MIHGVRPIDRMETAHRRIKRHLTLLGVKQISHPPAAMKRSILSMNRLLRFVTLSQRPPNAALCSLELTFRIEPWFTILIEAPLLGIGIKELT
jgi:hypothetical protein